MQKMQKGRDSKERKQFDDSKGCEESKKSKEGTE